MRKYDKKNKTNIFIVLSICAIILIIFFFFIKRFDEIKKKNYIISVNSVLFDADKNKWDLDSTGTMRIKWNGSYYMQYKEEEIPFKKQVVVYNRASKFINLYGKVYKINEDEKVEAYEDETIIDDTIVPKFYKLADRKYLIVGDSIKSEDEKFNTQNYLIIELDKLGNATLVNDKVNMKTLKETKLVTSLFTFDIANELLYYGDKKIDLKKIIGSTNLYKPAESKEEKPNGSGNKPAKPAKPNKPNNPSKPDTLPNKKPDKVPENNEVIDNNVYQDKNFNIVKNTIGTNYLNVDYTIYDPKNEYLTVFMEIENDVTKSSETYYLAKNGTTLNISGILPNTKYNIVYKYTYLDESENLQYGIYDANYSITTPFPDTYIDINKLTNKELKYDIREKQAMMLGATIELYVDDVKTDTYKFTTQEAVSKFSGVFDMTKYEKFNYVKLKCTNLVFNTGEIVTDIEAITKN